MVIQEIEHRNGSDTGGCRPETSRYREYCFVLPGELPDGYVVPYQCLQHHPSLLALIERPEAVINSYQNVGFSGYRGSVRLPDLDEDAAHTLVHFLQTGQYETLGSDSDMESEYRRNVLVYKAASKYKIPSLTALARDKIEMNSEKKSIFAVLDVASKVYEHVTEEDRAWLEEHVKVELQQEFGRGDMLPFSKVVLATMNQIIRDVETKALEREPVPVEVPETPDNIWGIETPKKKKKKRAGII